MKHYLKALTILGILFASSIYANPIGLMSAVPDESRLILSKIEHKKYIHKGLYHYWTGQLYHHHVVLMNTGVGSINAAVATSQMIEQFHPNSIIFFGTAGGASPSENVGNVEIVQNAFPFDYGDVNSSKPKTYAISYQPARMTREPILYPADHHLLNQAKKIKLHLFGYNHQNKVVSSTLTAGTIATSQHFPNTAFDATGLHRYHMPTIAMETTAIYKVCWMYKQPCIAFRAVSDLLTPYDTNIATQWNHRNALKASTNAEKAALSLVKQI